METREVQQALNGMGFGAGAVDGIEGAKTRTAVARFQLAYNRDRLTVDAIAGPKTWAAIRDAQSQNGRISDHFRTSELRSRGDQTCFVHRDLLAALERLRREVGRPLIIRSGWRDVRHNTTVGGARTSQHTFGAASELTAIRVRLAPDAHLHAGRAADFDRGYVTLEDARDLRLFSGIGYRKVGNVNWVTHVDVRADRTPSNPSIWVYN
jgi:peptidoglycan hydrolase-like protein with peptidoglycan-binding domain